MKKTKIMLSSIIDVKEFVNFANLHTCDIDLTSGRYTVDAKSIMGIFSLDLSKPIDIEIHADDEEAEKFLSNIAKFEVK